MKREDLVTSVRRSSPFHGAMSRKVIANAKLRSNSATKVLLQVINERKITRRLQQKKREVHSTIPHK